MNEEIKFLIEYEKLCQKYKMGLNGCGCCGSPFLDKLNDINYNSVLNKIFIGGTGFWHEKEKQGEKITESLKNKEKTIEEVIKELNI